MLIALCFTSDFDFAGQTSTHTPQPVQSSGATWIVIAIPDTSLDRNAFDLKPSGAPASSVGSYTFIRIDRVRTHGRTPAAVDADVRIEDRDLLRDRTLLVLRRARREDAVDGERRDRQQVAVAGQAAAR